MNQQSFQQVGRNSPEAIPTEMRRIEGREWWLLGFAVAVTLALTLGIISFTFPWFSRETDASYWFDLREWVRGLAALVLLLDFYAIYQHLQLHRIRRQLAERDQLFQLISENAADMIALVDSDGRRLYNSPAYQKVLGYSPEELKATSSIEQIHPDDRVQSDSFFYLLGFVVDEVAVLHQLADQGIDLLQTEWGLGAAFQIAADKAIFLDSHFQRSGAGLIDRRGAVLLSQRKNAQDAAHTDLALLAMDGVAERSDVRAGATGPPQQLGSAQRRPLRVILFFDAIPAAPLAHVFAQQLPGFGIEQANIQFIPLQRGTRPIQPGGAP
jgi:PAS domain-containing protein